MKRCFLLFFSFFAITIIFSCSNKIKPSLSLPCIFDKEHLTVYGDDYAFKDSLVVRGLYAPRSIMELLGYSFNDGYRITQKDNFDNELFDFSVFHCRDMEWTKRQILNEITRRYPYRIVDSTEIHRTYDFTFSDTSYFEPTSFTNPNDFALGEYRGKKIYFNCTYPGVLSIPINIAEINKDIRTHLGKINPPHLFTKLYDVSIPVKYVETPGDLDEYFTYLRDSMSVIVELAEEKVIPIKYIRLINNSQEK